MAQDKNNVLRMFSAKACAAPLEEVAKMYEKKTGNKIEISVCSRHCAEAVAEEATGAGADDFLLEISDAGIFDLAIGGAEYLIDDGEIRGIFKKGHRRTIAYRKSAIIVTKGNPKNIKSIEDLTKPGIRMGISVIDCLKGLWEDITARLGLFEGVCKNITFHANGCIAIIEAVAGDKIDAALGWTAFKHLDSERIDVVELPEEQQILRGTGIAVLSTSSQVEMAENFMDFIVLPESRECYEKYGWVIK